MAASSLKEVITTFLFGRLYPNKVTLCLQCPLKISKYILKKLYILCTVQVKKKIKLLNCFCWLDLQNDNRSKHTVFVYMKKKDMCTTVCKAFVPAAES